MPTASAMQTVSGNYMNTFSSIKLLTFGLLFFAINSFAQKCDCDSLLNIRTLQIMKRVKNYDSFKFITIRKKGVIKTISEKEKISKLLTSDSVWIPLYDHGDGITVKLVHLDSVAGREINFWDGTIIDSAKLASLTHDEAFRLVKMEFTISANRLKYVAEKIHLNDDYFEVYFNAEGEVIMSPTVCDKLNCDLIDNIISHFKYFK